MSNEPIGIVLSPTMPPEECIALCEEMGLIERMTHGEHDYVRFTKTGYNVLAGLMEIAQSIATEEPLKIS